MKTAITSVWNLVYCEHGTYTVSTLATFADIPTVEIVANYTKGRYGYTEDSAKEVVENGYCFAVCPHVGEREVTGPPKVGSCDHERIMLEEVALVPHC